MHKNVKLTPLGAEGQDDVGGLVSLPMSAYLDSDSQGQIVNHIAALRGDC